MSISPAAQCNYLVRVSRGAGGCWHGRADPASDDAYHPGLAGNRPEIELRDDVIMLRPTESGLSRARTPKYRDWGPPASEVSIPVGPAVSAVLAEGDVMVVSRLGTSDLAVVVLRGDALQLGLGAIACAPLGSEVTVQEDPRASEQWLYGIAATLEDPEATLVWIDLADPNCQSAINSIDDVPTKRVVIAIAGPEPAERRRMNNSIAAKRSPAWQSARWYVDVDARFATREQWVEHLRGLPKTRPTDLWVRFAVEGVTALLHEGEYRFESPWHLVVEKVYRPGIPGELSQLGLVREHPAVTKQMVMKSLRPIASRQIHFTR